MILQLQMKSLITWEDYQECGRGRDWEEDGRFIFYAILVSSKRTKEYLKISFPIAGNVHCNATLLFSLLPIIIS